jgi:hypothetical protein
MEKEILQLLKGTNKNKKINKNMKYKKRGKL